MNNENTYGKDGSMLKGCCNECHGEFTPKYGDGAYRCLKQSCPCHLQTTGEKVEVLERKDRPECMTANGMSICYCGECKQEDYKLPADFARIKDIIAPQPIEEWEKERQIIEKLLWAAYDPDMSPNMEELSEKIISIIRKVAHQEFERGVQFGRALEETETEAAGSYQAGKAETLRKVEEIINASTLGPTLCGNCNLNGPLCINCYANRKANNALVGLLEALKSL